ncbi:hypothetical protein EMCRGX_G005633 [Ephydatia muelleri]
MGGRVGDHESFAEGVRPNGGLPGAQPSHVISATGLQKGEETAGLDRRTVEVVKDLYHQTTFVRTKRNSTAPIQIERGVKQGCPLSPILFKLVMEVLIRVAGVEEAGYKMANCGICR